MLAAALALPVSTSLAAKGDVVLVSRQSTSDGGAGANKDSGRVAISNSGRFVAFRTLATNLGDDTTPNRQKLYVFDRALDQVGLVSRQSQAAGGAPADANSGSPDLSGNGRFVSFETSAQNLPGGTGSSHDKVYVYDRERQRAQLISRQSKRKGGALANGNSNTSAISGDGRFVAFNTAASNLGGPISPSGAINVYVYDRKEKRTELVSRRSAGGRGVNSTAVGPSISANGRFVAFETQATNLGGPAKDVSNVYVYDRKEKRVELVSRRSAKRNGAGANAASGSASISANGRFVAFQTQATNLGGDPTPTKRKIYVYDRKAKRVELVSRQSQSDGGQPADGMGQTEIGSISANGRFVGFTTDSNNLGGPIAAADKVKSYVYDREAKRVSLVSQTSGGLAANDSSFHPHPSANGRFVAFNTRAKNLGGMIDPGADFNVYVFDLLGP